MALQTPAVVTSAGYNQKLQAGDTVDLASGVGSPVLTSPQVTTIEVGHATDTTLARSSAGNVTVEGNLLYRAGGTDVPITDGGTGASTKEAAAIALGASRGLFSRYADAANTGSAEETLYSNTLAANTLATNGDFIEFKYWGIFAANANEKYLYVKFDSNILYQTADNDVIALSGTPWEIIGSITRVSNTVVRVSANFQAYGVVTPTWTRYKEVTGLDLAATAYAMTLRTANDAASDTTAKGGWARHTPAP